MNWMVIQTFFSLSRALEGDFMLGVNMWHVKNRSGPGLTRWGRNSCLGWQASRGGEERKRETGGRLGLFSSYFSLFVPAKQAFRKMAPTETPSILGNTHPNECALVIFYADAYNPAQVYAYIHSNYPPSPSHGQFPLAKFWCKLSSYVNTPSHSQCSQPWWFRKALAVNGGWWSPGFACARIGICSKISLSNHS